MTKKQFMEGTLAETLRSAKLEVERLELSEGGNEVRIIFENGYRRLVNIEADSFGAIVLDVTRKALY